jgi:large subunit ribosomal protein L9
MIMLVILRENIESLGRIGDLVKVSDGYARNFLLPRNLVAQANEKNVKALEHQKRVFDKKRQAQKQTAQDLATRVSQISCSISRKVGEHDKLFGSVTSADIAESLKKSGLNVEKRDIHLDAPIKSLGVHTVSIKLEPEVTATLQVTVVKEG